MLVPDLVEIAGSLACRFMFGLQNGDPKNVTFCKTFLENYKNPSVFASAKSFSLTFAGAGRTHLLYLFQKEFCRLRAFNRSTYKVMLDWKIKR